MPTEFETYLDEALAPPGDQLAKIEKRAATLAGRLPRAARSGDLRAVEAALRELATLRVEGPLAAAQAVLGEFDYRGYLESGFAADFEQACREAGIPLEGYFPTYSVFPFRVQVDVESLSAVVNKTRVGTLRPSVLAAAISAERDRLERSPFNAEEFLKALYRQWEKLNLEQGARHQVQLRQPVSLKKVYQELTPFRRWRRDYPESFFAFDVQRLLSSGIEEVDGHRCQLERGRSAASAIRLVDHEGQERLIATVNFVEA